MKRRTLIAALFAIVLLTISTTATLAYYRDTDSANNLAELGNVDLLIVENNWDGMEFLPTLSDGAQQYELNGSLSYTTAKPELEQLSAMPAPDDAHNLPTGYALMGYGATINTLIPSRIIPKNPVIHYVGQLPVYMAARVTINNRRDLLSALNAPVEQEDAPDFKLGNYNLSAILGDAHENVGLTENKVIISSAYFSDTATYTAEADKTLQIGTKEYIGTLVTRNADGKNECFITYSESAADDTATFTFFFFDIYKVGDETVELFDYYRVPSTFTNDDVKALTKNYSYDYAIITGVLQYAQHAVTKLYSPSLKENADDLPLSVETQAYCIQADSFGAGANGATAAFAQIIIQNKLDMD